MEDMQRWTEESGLSYLLWICDGELKSYDISNEIVRETKIYDVCQILSYDMVNKVYGLSTSGELLVNCHSGKTCTTNPINNQIVRLFNYGLNFERTGGGVVQLLLLDNKDNAWLCTSNNIDEAQLFMQDVKIEKLIHAAGFTVCLDNKGVLRSWGANGLGQLGVAKLKLRIDEPTIVPRIPKIKDFSCGISHTLALDYEGNIWGFGYNQEGTLGIGHRYNMDTPTKIEGLPPVESFICDGQCGAVLTKDNEVYIWGSLKNRETSLVPVCISEGKKYLQVEHGTIQHGLLLLDFDGILWSYDGALTQLSQLDPQIKFRKIKKIDSHITILFDMDGHLYYIDWTECALHKAKNLPPFSQRSGKRVKSSRNTFREPTKCAH